MNIENAFDNIYSDFKHIRKNYCTEWANLHETQYIYRNVNFDNVQISDKNTGNQRCTARWFINPILFSLV